MLKARSVTAALFGVLAVSACAGRPSNMPPLPGPAQGWVRVAEDSVIRLRPNPPPDSVVLHRGGATIVLSLRDVEQYFAEWRGTPPADVARLAEQIRRQSREAGWVELGDGMLEDLMAARLMESGQASVRTARNGRFLPRIRLATETRVAASNVIEYRVFYTPGGTLIFRVLGGVTVS
jgi:hypothetical protein